MKGTLAPVMAFICALCVLPAGAVPGSAVDVPAPSLPPNAPPLVRSQRRPELPLEFFNFMRECFQVKSLQDKHVFAAWMPLNAFIKLYTNAEGIAPIEELKSKSDAFKNCAVFVVENRGEDQFKNPTSESFESLKARATLQLPNGGMVKPLDKPPEGFPQSARMATIAGGRHGQMLIFPTGDQTDLDSETHAKGTLTLLLEKTQTQPSAIFSWYLPLEIGGPQGECAKCHRDVSKKWTFCPFCGTKIK